MAGYHITSPPASPGGSFQHKRPEHRAAPTSSRGQICCPGTQTDEQHGAALVPKVTLSGEAKEQACLAGGLDPSARSPPRPGRKVQMVGPCSYDEAVNTNGTAVPSPATPGPGPVFPTHPGRGKGKSYLLVGEFSGGGGYKGPAHTAGGSERARHANLRAFTRGMGIPKGGGRLRASPSAMIATACSRRPTHT